MEYRRIYQKGGCYFFTLVTHARARMLCDGPAPRILGRAITRARRNYPFTLEAIVLLPDHLHCVMRLPVSDDDFPTRIRLIKSGFTRRIRQHLRLSEGTTIWQPRYWEHLVRDAADFRRHIEYTHYNPVKHELVDAPIKWPLSSFHRYVETGVYDRSWGSSKPDIPDNVGSE